MISNDYISGFRTMIVRQLTVVEYRRRGGIWAVTSGVLMRMPEFNYIIGPMMSFNLHSDSNADWNTTTTHFELMSEDYIEPTFELLGDGSLGIVRGFSRRGYDVDVFLHSRSC